jgi:hypothetical protein
MVEEMTDPVDKVIEAEYRADWCLEQLERAEEEYKNAQRTLRDAKLAADEHAVKSLQKMRVIPINLPRRQYDRNKPALIIKEAKDLPPDTYANDGMYAWATKEHKLYLCQITGQYDIRNWCLVEKFEPEWKED